MPEIPREIEGIAESRFEAGHLSGIEGCLDTWCNEARSADIRYLR